MFSRPEKQPRGVFIRIKLHPYAVAKSEVVPKERSRDESLTFI